jgi:ribosomal protein S18 acetylase RimI-like enzyme
MHLKNSLITQADAYETMGHDTYFRVYVICVHPSYKAEGVAEALLETSIRFAAKMEVRERRDLSQLMQIRISSRMLASLILFNR